MPEIGEIKRAIEIGYEKQHRRFIWIACPDCQKTRWTPLQGRDNPLYLRCHRCANKANSGAKNHFWKGGKKTTDDGYIEVRTNSDSFFYPMAAKGHYVREHRLIMAQHLNRCLLPWEIVHHINGIRIDNRLENLELVKGNSRHAPFNQLQRENRRLEKLVRQLQDEIRKLQA